MATQELTDLENQQLIEERRRRHQELKRFMLANKRDMESLRSNRIFVEFCKSDADQVADDEKPALIPTNDLKMEAVINTLDLIRRTAQKQQRELHGVWSAFGKPYECLGTPIHFAQREMPVLNRDKLNGLVPEDAPDGAGAVDLDAIKAKATKQMRRDLTGGPTQAKRKVSITGNCGMVNPELAALMARKSVLELIAPKLAGISGPNAANIIEKRAAILRELHAPKGDPRHIVNRDILELKFPREMLERSENRATRARAGAHVIESHSVSLAGSPRPGAKPGEPSSRPESRGAPSAAGSPTAGGGGRAAPATGGRAAKASMSRTMPSLSAGLPGGTNRGGSHADRPASGALSDRSLQNLASGSGGPHGSMDLHGTSFSMYESGGQTSHAGERDPLGARGSMARSSMGGGGPSGRDSSVGLMGPSFRGSAADESRRRNVHSAMAAALKTKAPEPVIPGLVEYAFVPGDSPVLQWRFNFKKSRLGMRARLNDTLKARESDYSLDGQHIPVRRRASLSLGGPRGFAPPARVAELLLPGSSFSPPKRSSDQSPVQSRSTRRPPATAPSGPVDRASMSDSRGLLMSAGSQGGVGLSSMLSGRPGRFAAAAQTTLF